MTQNWFPKKYSWNKTDISNRTRIRPNKTKLFGRGGREGVLVQSFAQVRAKDSQKCGLWVEVGYIKNTSEV